MVDKTYNHQEIESKWQKRWETDNLYKTTDTIEGKDNFYLLFEFPYPSGNLHVGHWYAYGPNDIVARYKRMNGYNVLFPIGFDSFGLPAENAAIKRGLDPREWTYDNIEYMTNQIKAIGTSVDWSRSIRTSDPEYYKWTQYIFTKFLEGGLAYQDLATVNWCPKCQTVLANEQVVSGKCERCDTPVERREMKQWMLKITNYAEPLLEDLNTLDWPEEIKAAQKNWIGKSEGATFTFKVKVNQESISTNQEIVVFTTRPDTLFGVTYVVLAPENPLVAKLLENQDSQITNQKEVESYINKTASKSDVERQENKEKTGVELKGVKAIHPATGEDLPVWVADYVLGSYGTGAVMAVPGHDERDFEFANKHNLPVKEVIEPLVTRAKGEDAFREAEPIQERQAVVAIVKHWSENKYLGAHWLKTGWKGFVIGGIEDNENPIDAGLREIVEETGYENPEFVRELGSTIHARFFQMVKGENRLAHFTPLLFKLKDSQQKEISEEEKSLHELKWLSPEEMEKFITHPDMRIAWDRVDGKYCYCENGITHKGEFEQTGILVNSGEFSGLTSDEAGKKITEKFGQVATTYRLRDWSVGRQRYWGCPIPVVYDPDGNPHPVPEKHLPWTLPTDVDHTPTGEAPLARSRELKERTEKIFGKGWTPEVETLDTFVDSSWYYLRYLDPHNEKNLADPDKQKTWMPVNLYSGGAEHTTMHLLYARFFYKAMVDHGLASVGKEPFKRRMNRSLILGPDGAKMSKSKGNVVDPDEQVKYVGADTVRMYLAFLGPYNEVSSYPWDMGGIAGVRRFLEKVWRHQDYVSNEDNTGLESLLHKTIKKVGEEIENLKLNTAVASLMEFVNATEKEKAISRSQYERLLVILAPFAPHLTEEIWNLIGNDYSIHQQPWPSYRQDLVTETTVNLPVQVNGKVRATITVSVDMAQDEVVALATEVEAIKSRLSGAEISQIIYIPGRILNIVTS